MAELHRITCMHEYVLTDECEDVACVRLASIGQGTDLLFLSIIL